jgi:selenocysteine lyase/cysteine desulfurase
MGALKYGEIRRVSRLERVAGTREHRRIMTLSRRELLRLGSAATGALAAAQALGCTAPQQSAPATPPAAPAGTPASTPLEGPAGPDWDAIRAEFDLSDEYVHLASLLIASHPRVVRRAIEEHRRALDTNPADYLHRRWALQADGIDEDGEEQVMRAAARYLETEPDLVALTDSTTMGLAMVYNGVAIRPDQEILTTEHEHGATQLSLEFRARRTGCAMRTISLYDDAATVDAAGLVRALVDQIRPETRVVAITWVHSRSGVKLPVARIAAEIAARNQGRSTENRILLCVDAVHGFGIEDVTMADLGCDFFVAGCHKWLFGPRGTGIIWAPRHAWEQCLPTIPSFSGPVKQTPGRMMTPGGFHSFEHRWALAPAFDFHLAIGKAHVQARTHALATQLKRGLAAIPGVRLLTPMSDELSSSIIVFQVAGKTSEEVERALHARGIIATITPRQPNYPRLAPGILNTPEEMERTIEAVRALAR